MGLGARRGMSVLFQPEAGRAASRAMRSRFDLFRAGLCALFCFAVAPGASAAEEERVLLSAVRIEIDGRMFNWSADGFSANQHGSGPEFAAGTETKPDGETPARLKPQTVASFLALRPGRLYIAADLESRCRDAEIRLLVSGLFYAAQAVVLPSKKGCAGRTVLVSLTSGFLWRFGGGASFGSFGYSALSGERLSLRGYAGWNRNGAEILHENAAGLPILAGVAVSLYAPGEWSGMLAATGLPAGQPSAEAVATLGYSPAPDYQIGVGAAVLQTGLDRSGERIFSLQPYFRYRSPRLTGASDAPDLSGQDSNFVFSGWDARIYYFPQDGSAKAEASFALKWNATERASFNVKASGGLSRGMFGFDLFSAEDRSVRSGYGRDELSFPSFLLASAELRLSVAAMAFGPGLDCRIVPFIFCDAAVNGDEVRDSRFAAGPAVRLLFDSPVFAYFSASWGMNPEGDGRFILWGTAGF